MPDFHLCVVPHGRTYQVYGVVDEAGHKAAGGLPVVRVAQALIKAPIEEVALCWWQAGRRKVRTDSFAFERHPHSRQRLILFVCVALGTYVGVAGFGTWMACRRRRKVGEWKRNCCRGRVH